MLAGQNLDLAQVAAWCSRVSSPRVQLPALLAHLPGDAGAGSRRYVYLFAIANLNVLPALAGGAGGPGPAGTRGGLLLACATPILLYTGLHRLCGRGGGGGRHLDAL